MGFTEAEVRHMYFGYWSDLFEEYKEIVNIEHGSPVYKLNKEPERVSLLTL